ncbi:MAG: magnesium and cobalt transport protein CorA, partial [Phototrophicales bacterium]
PLMFVVGVYGMNFENMPELKMEYSYYVCLGAMAFMFLLMVAWVRIFL